MAIFAVVDGAVVELNSEFVEHDDVLGRFADCHVSALVATIVVVLKSKLFVHEQVLMS